MSISERIKRAREERGLTQKEVALSLGYKSGNAISEIERGKVQISASDLYTISDLLNKPISYFYGTDFGGKDVEDTIAILSNLSREERAQIRKLAKNMSDMKVFVSEMQMKNEDTSDRDALEKIYNFLIQQMLPISQQLRKANELKILIEEQLGINQSLSNIANDIEENDKS